MIKEMETMMNKVHKIKKIAVSGRYLCKDEMGRNNFELIIRELGDFQEWQSKFKGNPDDK